MDTTNQKTALVFGVILIVAGALFLINQVFGFLQWSAMWPLVNIGIGILFFVGMLVGGKQYGPLAIPGSIFTGVGLILLVQNLIGAWATWSYAWGLVIASIGIGIYIYGAYSDRPGARESGLNLAKIGLILFLVFGMIFELLFQITGISFTGSSIFFPLALAAVGLFLLIYRSVRLIRTPEKVSRDGRDLFWPVMFIGVGLLWMLFNLDWLTSTQMLSLLSLWPVLLIVIGIEILTGRRYPWVGALLGIVVVAGMFFFAFYGGQYGWTSRLNWMNIPFVISGTNSTGSGQRVTGSGIVTSEDRPVTGFSRVKFTTLGEAEIVQGDTESLTIEAEENLLPYITSQVRGNELVIGTLPGVSLTPTKTIRYKLSVKDLSAIDVSGLGRVSLAGLNTDSLSITGSGAAGVDLENLQANSLDTNLSGAGTVTVTGIVDRLMVRISGAGGFKGGDLQCQTANVSIPGLGNATVWVIQNLDVSITGAGSVDYYGSPNVTKHISGLGRVNSLGEK